MAVDLLGSDVASAFVQSTAFGQALDQVEARARAGVVAETQKNAVTLMLLALAGGAVGGYLFKGTTGLVVAGIIGYWAVNQLATGGSGGTSAQPVPAGSAQ